MIYAGKRGWGGVLNVVEGGKLFASIHETGPPVETTSRQERLRSLLNLRERARRRSSLMLAEAGSLGTPR